MNELDSHFKDEARLRQLAQKNVVACFILIFFLLSIPSVLMPIMYSPIMDDMGWSLTEISTFSSWKFLSGALTSLALWFLLDRVKLKLIVAFGTCMSGISLIGMLVVDTLWVYYIFGFVLGITSVIAAISCRVLLGRWYSRTLGSVVGIAFTGGSIGGIITPILGEALITAVGWQATAAIFGATIVIIVLPLFWILASEHPEEFGGSTGLVDASPSLKQDDTSGLEFDTLVRTRTFWLLMFAHFLVGCVNHTLMEHTPLYIERDLGFSAFIAAGSISVAMLASIAGKVGFGWLYDRLSMRGVAICWWLLAMGVAAALMISGPLTITLFVVLRGTAHGGVIVASPCIALHNFGARSIAKVVSLFSVSSMLGAALGTSTAGYLHDLTGSYVAPFTGLFVLTLIAGTIAAWITPKYWQGPSVDVATKQT